MELYEDRIMEAKKLIQEADYIIIGAGAGLSSAAGFDYDGQRFEHYFHDFKEKYGIQDMYSGSFYPFETEEEKWAYWAQMIDCNTYQTKPSKFYQELLNLIKDKDYFIITTNADHQFAINGFNMNRYFETQGNYIYFQCAKGCHRKAYYNEKIVKTMVAHTKNCQIPSYLIPICPKCGRPMSVHVRKDGYFVETKGWENHCNHYEHFLKKALRKKVVFIEIGVGFNTPTIIRYPFERFVYQHKNAYLIRINKDYPFCNEGNEKKVISFDEPVLDIIEKLEEKEDV